MIRTQAHGHNWLLSEGPQHFDLGQILNCAVTDALGVPQTGRVGAHHAGLWECDLADGSLIWSGGVYDLFGLERGSPITRAQALAHYSEDSRAKLERLRAHSIEHGQGFTLDVEIRAAAVGEVRRMRIIAAVICESKRLCGVKLVI